MLAYDRGARNYVYDWAPISAVNCRNGLGTVIVTADNSPTAQNGLKAPCWVQHTQIACFAWPYFPSFRPRNVSTGEGKYVPIKWNNWCLNQNKMKWRIFSRFHNSRVQYSYTIYSTADILVMENAVSLYTSKYCTTWMCLVEELIYNDQIVFQLKDLNRVPQE